MTGLFLEATKADKTRFTVEDWGGSSPKQKSWKDRYKQTEDSMRGIMMGLGDSKPNG